jgi:pentatricopeptide repeat protein
VVNRLSEKTLDLFETLPFESDQAIYVIVYNACASLSNERATTIGKKLLDEMPQRYFNDVNVSNSAMHMLMKIGDVQNAERLFSQIRRPTLVTYGVVINGYKINYQPQKCLELLEQMKRQKMILNEPISVSLINACSQIALKLTCQRILKDIPPHLHRNRRVASSLIDMWVRSSFK